MQMISEVLKQLQQLIEEVQKRENNGFKYTVFEIKQCTDTDSYEYSAWVIELPQLAENLKQLLSMLEIYEDLDITVEAYLSDQKEILVYMVYKVPGLGWTMRLVQLEYLLKEIAERLR